MSYDENDIQEYREELLGRGLAVSVVNKHISILRTALREGGTIRNAIAAANLAFPITQPKRKSKLKRQNPALQSDDSDSYESDELGSDEDAVASDHSESEQDVKDAEVEPVAVPEPVDEPNEDFVQKKFGSRDEVWGGRAERTRGGLSREDLKLNKRGKIVSKKSGR